MNILSLLLPVIFPSWRFFSGIGPSPRIYVAFVASEHQEPMDWHSFRPKPARVSFNEGLGRLLWSPVVNETLYMNTCAERLFEAYSPMREQEIAQRLLRAWRKGELISPEQANQMLFKITAVVREGLRVDEPTVFISSPIDLTKWE
jgi:hypothetical protein